jgi:hypothetical protein
MANPSDFDRKATTEDVYREFGVNAKTVHDWVKRGCPCDRKPAGNRYNVPEVAAWLQDMGLTGKKGRPRAYDSPDLDVERARKERAMADWWEERVKKAREQVIEIDALIPGLVAAVTTAKNRFMGWPAATAPQLAGLDAAAIQTRAEADFTAILNDLSTSFGAAAIRALGGMAATEETQAE